jgi:hypothetical protein
MTAPFTPDELAKAMAAGGHSLDTAATALEDAADSWTQFGHGHDGTDPATWLRERAEGFRADARAVRGES